MSRAETDRAEPLGLTVYAMPAPDAALERQRRSGRWKMLLVLAICSAPVVASYLVFYLLRPVGASAAYATLIQPQVDMPALEARTLDGRPLALQSLRGQWLLVVVDGGQCRGSCEKRLYLQRQLREMMGRDRDRIDKLWLVVDDAPVAPALRAALAATPAMTVARLPREQVSAWLAPAAGQQLEDHVYVVDPLGHWMMRAPVDPDPSKFRRDIDRLLRASASWDLPGRQTPADAPSAGR